MSTEKRIFWFEELEEKHNDIVGKKCANLGQMVHLGMPVPPGFAISIEMYRRFLDLSGASKEMRIYAEDLGDLKGVGIGTFDEVSRRLQDIIEEKDVPAEVRDPILRYYEELCERLGMPDAAVSVRSAGTESRPGMFETYLNVIGATDLLDKIKKVWASAYTPRAVAFRVNKGFPLIGDELGVAVPKMVNSRSSGVSFTVDPVTGDDTRIILEANWGLGEGVVSGSGSVDGFVVEKETLAIVNRHIGQKTRCVVNREKGAEWVDVPEKMQRIPCLADEEVLEIVKTGITVEKRLGCPQDMEWAVDGDLPFPKNLFWLQTRPAKVQVKKPVSTTDQIIDLLAKRYQ
ncbi:PEP/pyruvate-binding domain-containing protein [Desulfatiglans anilini]|uniref:PEP/pyruvate-binding domain-containing protein n=1 Tax=Desulfatiglans anilini TaxID=90728 RepID=UPI000402DCAA|nr:PEP/pyruvate-binding domain-containing protein [Desulfatiglans anilini]